MRGYKLHQWHDHHGIKYHSWMNKFYEYLFWDSEQYYNGKFSIFHKFLVFFLVKIISFENKIWIFFHSDSLNYLVIITIDMVYKNSTIIIKSIMNQLFFFPRSSIFFLSSLFSLLARKRSNHHFCHNKRSFKNSRRSLFNSQLFLNWMIFRYKVSEIPRNIATSWSVRFYLKLYSLWKRQRI